MRGDLPANQQAVQACHAAIELARNSLPPDVVHPHLVLLGVKSETELKGVIARLQRNSIRFDSFREPDLGDQLTAVATAPVSGKQRRQFRRYRCLGDAQGLPAAYSTVNNIKNEGVKK